MLGDVEFLMTDDFAEFTTAIQEVRQKKEEKAAEMKKLYAEFQQEMADLDKHAKSLYEAWQAKVSTEGEPVSTKKTKKTQ